MDYKKLINTIDNELKRYQKIFDDNYDLSNVNTSDIQYYGLYSDSFTDVLANINDKFLESTLDRISELYNLKIRVITGEFDQDIR